jgi:arginase
LAYLRKFTTRKIFFFESIIVERVSDNQRTLLITMSFFYDRGFFIRIYNMQAIVQCGLDTVFSEAIAYVKENSFGFGVSLDLDVIDPFDASGVGVPEANGISGKDLCQVLIQLRQELQLIGVEVVEYNPYHDKNQKTERLIQEILLSIFGV